MKEINCKIIQDLLPLYIDGVCSEDSKLLIEKHLSHCEDCRKYLEELKTEPMSEEEKENLFTVIGDSYHFLSGEFQNAVGNFTTTLLHEPKTEADNTKADEQTAKTDEACLEKLSTEWNRKWTLRLLLYLAAILIPYFLIWGLTEPAIYTIPPDDILVEELCQFDNGYIGFFLNDKKGQYSYTNVHSYPEEENGRQIFYFELIKPIISSSEDSVYITSQTNQPALAPSYWAINPSAVYWGSEDDPISIDEIRIRKNDEYKTVWKKGQTLPEKSSEEFSQKYDFTFPIE